MLQRLIAAVLGILGLAAIGLGVASATVWRADDTLVATAQAGENGNVVVTAPGVLEMGGSPVTVTARANGGNKVVLAVGRETDVNGWVGDDAHTVITGLTDRTTLTTEEAAGGAEPALSPDPDGSDLWVQQATGESSADLTWTPQSGRWVLLAAGAGEGATAPSVVLSWPQTVTTPWLVPGIVVGVLLLLVAIALVLRLRRGSRSSAPESWQPVETGPMPVVAGSANTSGGGQLVGDDDAPTVLLTRRQMREAAAVAASVPTPIVKPRPSDRSAPAPAGRSLLARMRGRGVADESAARRDAPEADAATSSPPARPTTRGSSPRGTTAPAPGSVAATPPIPPAATPAAPPTTPETAWRKAWGFPSVSAPGADDDGGDQTGPDNSRTGKDA